MPSSGAATHPGSNAGTYPLLPHHFDVSGNPQAQSHNYPSIETVQRSLGFFTLFAVLLAIAAHFPIKAFQIIIIAAGSLCFVGPATDTLLNYHRRVRSSDRPNLCNTILIVIITVPLFTALYVMLWYPQRRQDILVTSTDLVPSVRFPSVVLFQRKDWTSQANLLGRSGDTGSKCYLGWYNDNAPSCSSLPPESFGNSTQCTCEELWYNNDEVIEDFLWMNTTYRYILFDSPSWLLCNTPTYMLMLQTFFNYNVTQALQDSGSSTPSLLLAVYDPELGMQRAFEEGYTRMKLINANGIVAVNVGLNMRQAPDQAPANDYTIDISPTQDSDLTCDTSTTLSFQYPCHVSLFITIPNFERTITLRQKQMGWLDVAASAGAYLSFVQFVSWVISGQAFIA
ncbi:hypothetical protein N431DRAFT_554654 [Stipitochalara longipes BDJ]|nr:hypothetical protein N431DRAFT_554654 [Stipitochalara longipes BDJ]